MVPPSLSNEMPRRRATASSSERMIDAGALMVIETVTRSSGMPSKQRFHVRNGVDRDADLSDFAARLRRIGIVAELRRKIERD